MDPQALNYILNAPEFEKTDDARFFLGDVLGKGWAYIRLYLSNSYPHRYSRLVICRRYCCATVYFVVVGDK